MSRNTLPFSLHGDKPKITTQPFNHERSLMRKILCIMALASSALAHPALARDGQWYIEGNAGAAKVEKTTGRNDTTNAVVGVLKSKTGYDTGAIIGHDFGPIRLEAEASYRRVANGRLTPSTGTVVADLDGHLSAISYMGNALVDLGPDNGLQAFVGGGIGGTRVKLISTSAGVNESDSRFAWQALAGIRYPISNAVDLGLKYRLFNASGVDPHDTGIKGRFRSHSLMATIAYNFGGRNTPEEIPAPMAPPPAPVYQPAPEPVAAVTPPPPPPVCNKGPYIVFFDWNASELSPEATGILDSAISAYSNCASVPIMLAGYADRSGTPQYNVALSERRNSAVQTYLATHGVPVASISSQAFGEANPRVPTADGVRELQNRRVEITYGPGSGQ